MTKTTKLVFMVLIGLAMIEFSAGQSLNAATSSKVTKATQVTAKHSVSRAKSAKYAKVSKAAPSLKGVAAVYADKFNGRKTSSGQRFSQQALTAAHKTLPLGTIVRVTNVRNNQSVDVVVNDRGPWHKSRVIDLSSAAANKIGMLRAGLAQVELEIVDTTSS
jgi:rare lipoprotein A